MTEQEVQFPIILRRKVMLDAIKSLCCAVHNKRYYVVRRHINWMSWNFDEHPFAIALTCDESSLLGAKNRGVVSLEIMMRNKVDNQNKVQEMDDTSLEDFYVDAVTVFEQLSMMRDPKDEALPVVLKLGKDNAIECSNTDLNIQGLIVTVEVEF